MSRFWNRERRRRGGLLTLGLLSTAFPAILMVACQTTDTVATRAATPTPTMACLVFRPISWSRTDTPETQKQVIQHNAAWKALCT